MPAVYRRYQGGASGRTQNDHASGTRVELVRPLCSAIGDCPLKVCATEASHPEGCPEELSISEICVVEPSIAEICRDEMSALKVCATKSSLP
jgi:hypothetical protein